MPLSQGTSANAALAASSADAASHWHLFNVGACCFYIASDKKHDAWFPIGTNFIGKMDAGGSVLTYPIPFQNLGYDMVRGNDDDIWFASGTVIGRASTSGSISSYSAKGFTQFLTRGFGHDIWYTTTTTTTIPGSPFVAHMAYDGTTKTYPVPPNPMGGLPPHPDGITRGPDRSLWFTTDTAYEHYCTIEKLNPATAAITSYPMQNNICTGLYIVAGPDRRLWTVGYDFNSDTTIVIAMTAHGVVKTYQLPANYLATATQIAVGRDHALYFGAVNTAQMPAASVTAMHHLIEKQFTEDRVSLERSLKVQVPSSSVALMRLTTDGHFTVYGAPSQLSCCLDGMATGPHGDIWFSDYPIVGFYRTDHSWSSPDIDTTLASPQTEDADIDP